MVLLEPLSQQHRRTLYRAHMAFLKQAGRAWEVEQLMDADENRLLLRLEGHGCYHALIKLWVPQANEAKLIEQLKALPDNRILVADYVNAAMAERLRKQRLFFIDAAGNAYLDEPSLYLFIKGYKPQREKGARGSVENIAAKRAFTFTGLQLLYCFLADPTSVQRSYRQLAEMAGIAVGSIGPILRELKQAGYLIERSLDKEERSQRGKAARSTQRELVNLVQLAEQWSLNYGQVLRERKQLGRFRVRDWQQLQNDRLSSYGCWSGQQAVTGAIRGDCRSTLYLHKGKADGGSLQQLSDMLNITNSPSGELDVIEAFWPSEPGGEIHPLVVYSDLLNEGVEKNSQTMRSLWQQVVVDLERWENH